MRNRSKDQFVCHLYLKRRTFRKSDQMDTHKLKYLMQCRRCEAFTYFSRFRISLRSMLRIFFFDPSPMKRTTFSQQLKNAPQFNCIRKIYRIRGQVSKTDFGLLFPFDFVIAKLEMNNINDFFLFLCSGFFCSPSRVG